jgi:hypothetical protein
MYIIYFEYIPEFGIKHYDLFVQHYLTRQSISGDERKKKYINRGQNTSFIYIKRLLAELLSDYG